MQQMLNEPSTMRFSTVDLPERERVAMFREVFGRSIANMEITPLTDAPQASVALRTLPGLDVMWGSNSPHRFEMSRDPARGSDELVLLWASSPDSVKLVKHVNRDMILGNGTAVLMSCAHTASTECSSTFHHITLKLQRTSLRSLIANPEDALMHPIRPEGEALRLLKAYLGVLHDHGEPQAPEIERAVVTHIYDLVALAVGTTRDITELASSRGLRVARFNAVKKLVLENLVRPDLTVNKVAAAQNVSPRYIQMLFEAEGTTFSAYVLHERLAHAHRALSDSRFADQPIGVVALDAGFGDLSYFNRVFRRTYGETPSDVRNRACQQRHS